MWSISVVILCPSIRFVKCVFSTLQYKLASVNGTVIPWSPINSIPVRPTNWN